MVALNIQDADALTLKHQGDGEFGSHAVNRIDVARVFADVADAYGVAGRCGRSGNSLAKRDA